MMANLCQFPVLLLKTQHTSNGLSDGNQTISCSFNLQIWKSTYTIHLKRLMTQFSLYLYEIKI